MRHLTGPLPANPSRTTALAALISLGGGAQLGVAPATPALAGSSYAGVPCASSRTMEVAGSSRPPVLSTSRRAFSIGHRVCSERVGG